MTRTAGGTRLLDLFCKAGGAGYDVVGVDIEPQPRYPFKFIQSDALEYLAAHGHEYDVIHASPPCQSYSDMQRLNTYDAGGYPRLIDALRSLLEATGKPYIIENVRGARREMRNPFVLCGFAFGLKTYRHRLFESNLYIMTPSHISHPEPCPPSGRGASKQHGIISVTGSGGAQGLSVPYMDYAGAAMGIDWMSREELSEAIPPAYTEWIGRQLLQAVTS